MLTEWARIKMQACNSKFQGYFSVLIPQLWEKQHEWQWHGWKLNLCPNHSWNSSFAGWGNFSEIQVSYLKNEGHIYLTELLENNLR